jgi:hypothetical protein
MFNINNLAYRKSLPLVSHDFYEKIRDKSCVLKVEDFDLRYNNGRAYIWVLGMKGLNVKVYEVDMEGMMIMLIRWGLIDGLVVGDKVIIKEDEERGFEMSFEEFIDKNGEDYLVLIDIIDLAINQDEKIMGLIS